MMRATATLAVGGRARSASQSATRSIRSLFGIGSNCGGGEPRAALCTACDFRLDGTADVAQMEQLRSRTAAASPAELDAFRVGSRARSEIWLGHGARGRQSMSTAAVEASEPSTAEGIVITDSCIRRLKELQMQDGAAGQNLMLRLTVDGGGCSGFLYNFSLDENKNSDDRLFEKGGVTVVVDEISLSFVKGSTIDFSEELIRASFTVAANPNAASGCGCGASFTAK